MRTGAFDYEIFVSNILNKNEAKAKEILVNTFKVSGERADLISSRCQASCPKKVSPNTKHL